MSSKDLHLVFANLDEVSRFAETFAEVLEAAKGSEDLEEMDDHIGQVFCEMVSPTGRVQGPVELTCVHQIPRLEKIYSTYCSRHDRAIIRLQELEEGLRTYLLECRTLSSGRTQAWDLGSLLIKPVQRALKWVPIVEKSTTVV